MEKANILVVEDEGIIAKDIERTLRSLGYSVPAIAASGEEAIQKALETQPDLILMDIVLRGKMDGVEAAERILARQKIPIIYLTAYSDEPTFQRAKITEPFGYLLKPFQGKELQNTIEVALYKCQMEKKLKENEQWLSITLQSINDGVITTKNDGLITFMNPMAEVLAGWKEVEAVGRPLAEVFQVIHEGSGKKYEIPMQKAAGEGITVGRGDSILLVAKNGRKRPIDYSLAPLGDGQGNISGTVLAFRDITQRKKAEENLQRERDRLEIVTRNIGAGVAIISRDYRTIWANQVLKQIFGEVEGKLCHSTYNQREEVCTDCGVKKIFQKQADKVAHEQKGEDKSGKEIWSEIIATPIKDKKGNITAAVELVVPITERKRTEEALRQSEKAAKQLARENTSLAKIGQIISSTLNIEEIYSRFAKEAQELIPFDRISINLLNDNKTTFLIQYGWGIPIPNRQAGDTFPAAGSLSGEVIKNRQGRILHIEEEKEIASRLPAFTSTGKAGLQSTLVVPLVSKDEAFGVLMFFSKKIKAYTNDDLRLAESIGTQVVGAIANAQLFSDLKHARETQYRLLQEETILLQIGRIVASTLKIEEVYERFAEEAKKLIPFERITISILSGDKTTFSLPYVSGVPLPDRQPGDVYPVAGSLGGEVVKNRCGGIWDIGQEKEILSRLPGFLPVVRAGFNSTLMVPLISKDEVIGVLGFFSKKPKAYTHHDLELGQSIGIQVAGIIANARLYNELKHMVETLQESKIRYQVLVEAVGQAGDGMVMLQDIGPKEAMIVFANEVAQKITGYSAEELGNLSWIDIVHPSTREMVLDRIRRRMRGESMPGIFEGLIRSKNGREIPVELTATGSMIQGKPALIGFFREITQRKQAEEALKKSKAFNENILNSMNEALAIIDVRDFRVVQANLAFFDMVGMEEEKVIGKKCYEVTHDQTTPCDSHDHICPISETLKTGNPATAEHVHHTKDGAKINVEVSSSPLRNEQGEIVQVVHLERDITEKRNLESQLSQAQKLEAIGQLAAGIAHEINTPTQYIGDNTKFFQDSFKDVSLLLDQYGSLLRALKESHPPDGLIRQVEVTAQKIDLPYLSREIPRAIQQTLEGVNHVANIVRAMKEFSHPGTKEMTPIQINRAIENALTVSRNEWKYVAEVVTDLDPSLPPVPCLPQEFNQVILNILINAAHAITEALGQPSLGKGTITISTRRAGDWAEIRIRDTGTGIPAEIQSKVFEPFFTTKKVGKGTGQGLAIAYAFIVKKQGGTIHFETEVGKGTTFIIRLPLSAQTESLSPAGSSEGKAA